MNITQLLRQARSKQQTEHRDAEKLKMGTLRAGSSGVMSETGDIAGHCHRKSHLRSLGVELESPTTDKLIMFELGFANETVILEQLQTVLEPDQVILAEEEIPIEWLTTNGTRVTGRPDLVICKQSTQSLDGSDDKNRLGVNVPILGLELKSVHSVWTAKEVLFNRTPKFDHLVQAGHYMWKLNIPYKLIYKSYSQLGQGATGNAWFGKMFPREGEPGSEYIEYTGKDDRRSIKQISQFEIVYDLQFAESGRLQYKSEGSTTWTQTIITKQDIERYYEYVSQMGQKQELGPRPLTITPDGQKASYSNCNYCPLRATCDDYEKIGYEKWLEQVNKISTKVISRDTDK